VHSVSELKCKIEGRRRTYLMLAMKTLLKEDWPTAFSSFISSCSSLVFPSLSSSCASSVLLCFYLFREGWCNRRRGWCLCVGWSMLLSVSVSFSFPLVPCFFLFSPEFCLCFCSSLSLSSALCLLSFSFAFVRPVSPLVCVLPVFVLFVLSL